MYIPYKILEKNYFSEAGSISMTHTLTSLRTDHDVGDGMKQLLDSSYHISCNLLQVAHVIRLRQLNVGRPFQPIQVCLHTTNCHTLLVSTKYMIVHARVLSQYILFGIQLDQTLKLPFTSKVA